jgi:hypothetical protein
MKYHSTCSRAGIACCCLGAAALAHAQFEYDDLSLSKNRLRVSARFGFDVRADVQNLAPATAGVGTYDDGYVLPDISGGAGGKTWNWGYKNASQVVGDTLQLHRVDGSPRDGTTDALSQTPTPGFEILYGRELKRFALGENRAIVLGAEAGFSAMDMNLRGGSTMNGTIAETTDTYSLGGITPPLAPYAGTFTGPGPLIGSTPLSSTSTDLAATSSISEKVRSLVYGFKLGPYVEVPLYKRFSLDLGAGLAAVIADTQLSYTETITAPAGFNPTLARTYQVNHSDLLLGFYGSADLAFEVANDFRVYVGGQYQHLGNATATGGDKTATLKLGGTIEAVVGVEVGF